MRYEIKNLHGDTFSIEIEDNETVKALKEKIAARDDLREKYDPELLKLLCTGKVMDDEDMLNTYTVKSDGFLVLVKQTPGKEKPPPKKKPHQNYNNYMGGFNSPSGMGLTPNSFMQHSFEQSPFMQQTFQPNSLMQQPFQQNSSMQQPFPTSSSESLSQFTAAGATDHLSDTSPESFSTSQEREEALQSLLAMGFDRSQSEEALRSSFYNLEGAVEYLTSGNIPSVSATPQSSLATKSEQKTNAPISQQQPPLSLVANRPQETAEMGSSIEQMARFLRQHPEQLQTLKQRIQGEHPEIAQLIDENPQDFLDMIRQASGVEDENDEIAPAATSNNHAPAVQQQQTIKVSLTPSEQQAINRIQEMGFGRNQIIEAFLACERNEELAVAYLLNAYD